MPSKPQPIPKRVLVRHSSGAEKYVLRSQLDSLSQRWTRVADPAKKRPPAEAESVEQPAEPDVEKE